MTDRQTTLRRNVWG